MEAKKCSACGTEKPIAEFYRDHNRSDGLTARCKPCYRAKLAEYQKRRSGINAAKDGMKRCTLCKETKPVAEFNRNKTFGDGLHSACKACTGARFADWYAKADKTTLSANQRARYKKNPDRYADYELKAHYGLEHGTYDQMLAAQNGRCAICGIDDPGSRSRRRTRRFAVDHCHNTQAIRGLLCGNCNRGIGYLKHSIQFLESAIKYLSLSEGAS